MTPSLPEQWNTHTEELLAQLAGFDESTFNTHPSPDAWSAGDVAEHLLMIDRRLINNLGALHNATERDPAEKIPQIAARLADRVTRIDAPAALVPSEQPKDRDTLIADIRAERTTIAQLIESKDMNLENTETPHRFFGTMTGYEWVIFTILHAQRHMLQLDEIKMKTSR